MLKNTALVSEGTALVLKDTALVSENTALVSENTALVSENTALGGHSPRVRDTALVSALVSGDTALVSEGTALVSEDCKCLFFFGGCPSPMVSAPPLSGRRRQRYERAGTCPVFEINENRL